MLSDDDEPADLLADEDRVRDALLAAVDGQLVPPVRTDLVDIVHRGKRRARLQVVSASVAAVVLIAAVALGATVLGRLGGPDRVNTAGPSTSLPVTSQTIATTSNPPDPSSYFADAACIYPGVNGTTKWVPLNGKQMAQFFEAMSELKLGPVHQVVPTAEQKLSSDALASTESLTFSMNGRSTLMTLSTSFYLGNQTVAAEVDSRQTNMPGDCVGEVQQDPMGRALVNEYSPLSAKLKATGNAPLFLRVQVYSSSGIRYDLTEVTNADALIEYPSMAGKSTSPTTANSGSPANAMAWPVVPVSELAQIAFQVASQ